MPPMDEPQRIAVETEAGWLRIRENVEKGMMASIESRLASLPGGRDGETSRRVRKEIEARMAKIQESMWGMAAHNLRVNGHDYDKFVQATEPFDEVLDRNLWALNAERVEWEIIVSEQRKQRPTQLLKLERDIERRREHAEWMPEGEDEEDVIKAKKAAEIPRPPRHAETVKTFEQVAENLAELGKAVPAQLARAQRAQTVREEIASIPQ